MSVSAGSDGFVVFRTGWWY